MYVATVEVATQRELELPDSIEALRDYAPIMGRSSRGWVEVEISFQATGLAHACAKATSVARALTGAEAIACQVMTSVEYEARNGLAPGSLTGGRHASPLLPGPVIPTQATTSPDLVNRRRGRHSA